MAGAPPWGGSWLEPVTRRLANPAERSVDCSARFVPPEQLPFTSVAPSDSAHLRAYHARATWAWVRKGCNVHDASGLPEQFRALSARYSFHGVRKGCVASTLARVRIELEAKVYRARARLTRDSVAISIRTPVVGAPKGDTSRKNRHLERFGYGGTTTARAFGGSARRSAARRRLDPRACVARLAAHSWMRAMLAVRLRCGREYCALRRRTVTGARLRLRPGAAWLRGGAARIARAGSAPRARRPRRDLPISRPTSEASLRRRAT